MLAQNQSDAAENRAEAAARESARLRRVCSASWGVSAVVAVALTCVGVKLGFDARFAQGEAAAQAALAQAERRDAQQARSELATLKQKSRGEAMAEVRDRPR